MKIVVDGFCDPAFQSARDAFETNFTQRDELGASLCVFKGGKKVVDLWGGYKDAEKTLVWDKDTISIVFSCTKAATALCLHILIDRGLIALDDLVSQYWPEFAKNGKEATTVRMMLEHSSGVPAFRDPIKPSGYCDFDYMVKRVEDEEAFWEVGTKGGYHMVSFGWTVGELVRRVSGQSLGAFFRDEIARRYDLDFHIGLPETEFSRVANMTSYSPSPTDQFSDFALSLMQNPKSLQFLSLMNNGHWDFNSPQSWIAEIGGAGGISNARGLAGMYQALIGPGSFLSQARIDDMSKVSRENETDQTLLIPTRFGQGFMLSMENKDVRGAGNSAVIGKTAFGHVGMGGSIGFADPEAGLAFGYTMNRMGGGILLNERGQSLIDVIYGAL